MNQEPNQIELLNSQQLSLIETSFLDSLSTINVFMDDLIKRELELFERGDFSNATDLYNVLHFVASKLIELKNKQLFFLESFTLKYNASKSIWFEHMLGLLATREESFGYVKEIFWATATFPSDTEISGIGFSNRNLPTTLRILEEIKKNNPDCINSLLCYQLIKEANGLDMDVWVKAISLITSKANIDILTVLNYELNYRGERAYGDYIFEFIDAVLVSSLKAPFLKHLGWVKEISEKVLSNKPFINKLFETLMNDFLELASSSKNDEPTEKLLKLIVKISKEIKERREEFRQGKSHITKDKFDWIETTLYSFVFQGNYADAVFRSMLQNPQFYITINSSPQLALYLIINLPQDLALLPYTFYKNDDVRIAFYIGLFQSILSNQTIDSQIIYSYLKDKFKGFDLILMALEISRIDGALLSIESDWSEREFDIDKVIILGTILDKIDSGENSVLSYNYLLKSIQRIFFNKTKVYTLTFTKILETLPWNFSSSDGTTVTHLLKVMNRIRIKFNHPGTVTQEDWALVTLTVKNLIKMCTEYKNKKMEAGF